MTSASRSQEDITGRPESHAGRPVFVIHGVTSGTPRTFLGSGPGAGRARTAPAESIVDQRFYPEGGSR